MTNRAHNTITLPANNATAKATIVRFSPEWWSYWSGVWAVILTAAAALAGVVSWYFAQIVAETADQRAAELVATTKALDFKVAEQQEKVAEQQERAATAESELLRLRQAIAPRSVDPQIFVRELKGRRKAAGVEIPNDPEAYLLAVQLRRWLGPGSGGDGLNWGTVPDARPMTQRDRVGPLANDPNAPASLQSGVLFGGLALAVKKLENELPNPFNPPTEMEPVAALMFALQKAGIPAVSVMQIPSFPEGYIRIMVGHKPN